MNEPIRKFPIGAEWIPGRGVHFRVWAPAAQTAGIEFTIQNDVAVPLTREPDGYFSGLIASARPGMRYRIRLDEGSYPDPASRYQPNGPHGPSEIVDPDYPWTDSGWRGRPTRELVIYELHLGTFTPEGTWRAARHELAELARLGITMIEIMPIGDFPGKFGWGYDGVNLFAPAQIYGPPTEVRAFVNRAHELGVAVILDVVYNHFGPDGNYLRSFSPDYFSRNPEYHGEWGDLLNFDGDRSGPVREFFVTNARYWIDEYHFDGLRLDATQAILDASPVHILQEIGVAARAAAPGRRIFLVAENEAQHPHLVREPERGGYGLDALWNDDFHHSARVAATGRHEAYLSGYRGTAQEFVSSLKRGFLYQGQWYRWQSHRRGRAALDLAPTQFVHFLQNHDQVSNSLLGLRMSQHTDPGRLRALTALLLLTPPIPLLFQGQEFAASSPFLYFADHAPELAQQVATGRRGFLSQFTTIATSEGEAALAVPHEPATFARCQLDLGERQRHAPVYRLHADLLRLRRELPLLTEPAEFDGAVLGEQAFVLRFFGRDEHDALLVVNLGLDLRLEAAPEPLLAPLEGQGWRVRWSSEHPDYAGGGTAPIETTAGWMIPGHAAVLLTSHEDHPLPGAKSGQKD